MNPPYRCLFCGAPSWRESGEQVPLPDYCHEEDHGTPEEYLDGAGEAHEFFRFAQEYTEIRESISKNYSLADNFVTAKNIFDSRCFFRS
ncbi:hypothetical protein [Acidithiobacillus concretivorus]|uniref:Uncharacterized protein n=1 Tax=Acidithiobacillus concretivorus TaxID=3063952 RepID=A0ABS5ZSV1_9PROT|nr:hypothetical protein [Acidithiobacillus concretivorus]MBU2739587.1 hypothetical protein [Acidithiobacillus concretivorus]